jgi:hypothetical protein
MCLLGFISSLLSWEKGFDVVVVVVDVVSNQKG